MAKAASEAMRDIAEAVRRADRLTVVGSGTKTAFVGETEGATPIRTEWLSGIRELSPADQVVVVGAGTSIEELQAELRRQGQCLPLPSVEEFGALLAGLPGTVGGLVAMRMPHILEGCCGSVRDWILGATVIRPDGEIAKSGSMAVKSVAGYDVHRLMVGSRGSFGLIAEVILRTYPLRALPLPRVTFGPCRDAGWNGIEHGERLTIRRHLRSDVEAEASAANDRLIAYDVESATLWMVGDAPPVKPTPYWSIYSHRRPHFDPPIGDWDRRAKATLDPASKMNSGVWDE